MEVMELGFHGTLKLSQEEIHATTSLPIKTLAAALQDIVCNTAKSVTQFGGIDKSLHFPDEITIADIYAFLFQGCGLDTGANDGL